MTKISEMIEIKTAYSTQVNLREEFGDQDVNLQRMERYRPIQSHRQAFEKISRGLLEKDNKRFYLLTGSYGTGKSHLALMFSNYLSTPSVTPEINTFFENYKDMCEQDGEATNQIEKWKLVRKNGKFLVCICDYDSNETFMEVVLKSIVQALEREGIEGETLVTPYREAKRKLEEWKILSEEGNKDFYGEFQKSLSFKLPGTTINQFIKGIDKDFDPEYLRIFKQIHKEITTVDFVLSKDNLVAIVKDLVQSDIFKEHFKGIAIIFDEFGYILKNKRFDLNIFQAFGEFCSKSYLDGTPVLMVATGHKSFVNYKSRYNEDDFSVVSNRIQEISLRTEGFEDIISAIVIPKKNSSLWKDYIRPNRRIFDAMTQSCVEHGIFGHLSGSGKKLREKIIENIYPMHPMATYVLLELSKDIGSNNRSVFTFFTDKYRKDEIGSYNWFINTFDIVDSINNLNLYTVNFLYEYFKPLISSDNTELPDSRKSIIRNFEVSVKELREFYSTQQTLLEDENQILSERILNTLVLFNLTNVSASENNIMFGFNADISPDFEAKIKSILRYLVKNHILFFNKQTHIYEFKKNDLIDIDGKIDEYIENEENYNIDLIEELTKLGKKKEYSELYQIFREDFFPGKSYNREWSEDKRFKRIFTTADEISGSTFFEKMDIHLNEENDPKNSYEGLAIIVLCEDENEREIAKTKAIQNSRLNIVIAVPNKNIPIKEHLIRVLAAENAFIEKLSDQELMFIADKRKTNSYSLASQLNQYLDERNLNWYGQKGMPLISNLREEYNAVSVLLSKIYEGKRNRIKHSDANKIHTIDKTGLAALKDTVDRLLDRENDITWKSKIAEDSADVRFFDKFLVPTGIIQIVEEDRNFKKGKLQLDVSVYKETVPLLAALINEIQENQKNTTPTSIISLLNICSKYGAGHISTCLSIAVAFRYFADGLNVKSSPNAKGSISVQGYSDIENIVIKKQYINAVIQIIELTDIEKTFINDIYQVFDNVPLTSNVSIDRCLEIIENWYNSLPNISKIKSYYSDIRFHTLIDLFSSIKSYSAPNFIIRKLQTLIGNEEDDLINEQTKREVSDLLRYAKLEMPQIYKRVKANISKQIAEIFSGNIIDKPVGDDDLKKYLLKWYDSLNEVQKDIQNAKHSPDSTHLVFMVSTILDVEKDIYQELSENLGLQKTIDWSTDKTDDFVIKIKQAKNHVEANVVEVEDAILIIPDDWAQVSEGNNTVIYFLPDSYLEFKAPSSEIAIQLTIKVSNSISDTNKQTLIEDEYKLIPASDEELLEFQTIDVKGRKGNLRKLTLRAEKLKYEARDMFREEQQEMFMDDKHIDLKNDEESLFIPSVPQDGYSLGVCINSIINKTISKRNLPKNEVKKILKNMLDTLGD